MQDEKEIVFIVSNEKWGKQWFIKHHYANELSLLGHDVYFIDPVVRWRPWHLWDRGLKIEEISENLSIIRYNNCLPVRIFLKLSVSVNDAVIAKALSKIQNDKDLIIWQFDPFRFVNNYFKRAKKIYHIADDYRGLRLDKLSVASSDLIICTSKLFLPHYSLFGKPLIHIPHGISSLEKKVDEKMVKRLEVEYGPYLFHAGSINDRLDFELLEELVSRAFPTNLVLAGPISIKIESNQRKFTACIAKENVHYLGVIPGGEVKNYVKASIACLLIYKPDEATSSLKVLNYLVQKKPIISSLWIEYPELTNAGLNCVRDKEEYLRLVDLACKQQLEIDSKSIDSFLESKTYKTYLNEINGALETPYYPHKYSKHIVFVISNESSVPYFKWFATRAKQQNEFRISFISLFNNRPKMLDEMNQLGWNSYWLHYDSSKRKRGMIRCFFELYLLFRRIKPDVVHTHLFDDSVPGLLAARLARVKKRVITKQDTTYHWYYASKWVWFDRLNNHNATHIHAVATENREFIIKKEKANEKKVHLVRNGFPSKIITNWNQDSIDSLKATYNLNNRIVIGTVARYIHWKGHHLIIEAAKRLINSYPEVLFIWAGSDDGSGYRGSLQKMILEAGLENNIKMLGWVDRKDMPSLYKCMDIYLHPALREPFGFVISEALMNEVPILATKTGSTDLVEHQVNGYLLQIDNVDEIVRGVEYLLEDDERRAQIAKLGKKHAMENLTFESMWKGHIEMYES